MAAPQLFTSKTTTENDFFSTIQPSASIDRAITVVAREMSFTVAGTNTANDRGEGLATRSANYKIPKVHPESRFLRMAVIMDGIRWRFQLQERILLIWAHLTYHRAIPIETLWRQIDFHSEEIMVSPSMQALTRALLQYPALAGLDSGFSTDPRIPKDSLRGNFKQPFHWLATMILRSNSNAKDIFTHMDLLVKPAFPYQKTGINLHALGDLKYDPTFACPAAPNQDFKNPQLGFTLPHGDIRGWARKTAGRYTAVRAAYLDIFGVHSWPLDPKFCELLRDFDQYTPAFFEYIGGFDSDLGVITL